MRRMMRLVRLRVRTSDVEDALERKVRACSTIGADSTDAEAEATRAEAATALPNRYFISPGERKRGCSVRC